MCGIAGYTGPRNAIEIVYDQLKRLEYRGYDSAGIAFPHDDAIEIVKKAGKLSVLGENLALLPQDIESAIGHSRWATHGGPTDANAHPHFDQVGEVAIIHNGIIENYLDLREELIAKGHVFKSQTDTEVAAHVIGEEYAKRDSLAEAVRHAVQRLRGAFAIVAISKREPGVLVAVRNASPLVVGFGNGETFLASDIPALLPYTRSVQILEEGAVATVSAKGVILVDTDGRSLPLKPFEVDWDLHSAERGGFDHFMLKEIHEQPEVLRQVTLGRIDEEHSISLQGVFSDYVWAEVDRINIVACGTAYHAGLMGKHLFEKLLRLPTDVYYSSEFRYGDPVLSPRSMAIFVSQSGETADTLAALRLCKQRRIRTLGIVNVVGSSIARECDRTIFTQAGPEISVASTKAYTAQVMVLTLLALHMAQVQETPGIRVNEWAEELLRLPDLAQQTLQCEPQVQQLALELQRQRLAFFLGRGADSSIALEAALKLKEVAYVPTQESPAGEMKHGPLALIDESVVAFFGSTDKLIAEKVVSNMREVQARGGVVAAITTEDDRIVSDVADYVVRIPGAKFEFLSSLLTIIPYQLLAYHWAKLKGCEIDQPRNLAKSVTVE